VTEEQPVNRFRSGHSAAALIVTVAMVATLAESSQAQAKLRIE
jgi:hypothetical protein